MFCFNCGAQLPDNVDFCAHCGAKLTEAKAAAAQSAATIQQVQQAAPAPQATPIPQAVPTPAPAATAKKKGGKKPLLIALIILLVAAIAVGAIFIIPALSGSSGGAYSTHDELGRLRSGTYIYNGTPISDPYGSRGTFSAAALSGNCYVTHEGTCITDGKILRIENAGDPNGCCYAVASSGSAVAYYTTTGGIALLDCATDNVTVIEPYGDFMGVVISPDGKSVLYGNGHYNNSQDIYIYKDGTKTKLNVPPTTLCSSVVAIDNDGHAYVRVCDSNHESYMAADLYCFDSKGSVVNVAKNAATRFFTNADNTQIGFYTDRDGLESISVYDVKTNTVTKISIAGTHEYIGAMPMPLCEYSVNSFNFRDFASMRIDMLPAAHYNTGDLLSCYYGPSFYFGSKGACEIKNGALVPITDANLIRNLSDGSLMYCALQPHYSEYGRLTRYKNGSKEVIAEGVVGFGLSMDEKTIYYFTEYDELWINKNGSNTKIADNVCTENYNSGLERIGYETPCIVGNDIFLYRDNNGVCYIYNNGNITRAENIDYFMYYSVDTGYYDCLVNRSARAVMSPNGSGAAFRTTNYLPYTDINGNSCIMTADGSTKIVG